MLDIVLNTVSIPNVVTLHVILIHSGAPIRMAPQRFISLFRVPLGTHSRHHVESCQKSSRQLSHSPSLQEPCLSGVEMTHLHDHGSFLSKHLWTLAEPIYTSALYEVSLRQVQGRQTLERPGDRVGFPK